MLFRELLAVAIGGALGTLARVGAIYATDHLVWGSLIATLAVNLLGAFGLAFVHSRGLDEFPAWVAPGVTIGFFGSYTTFSAISLITLTLPVLPALGYLLLTLLSGWGAVWLGLRWGLASNSARAS